MNLVPNNVHMHDVARARQAELRSASLSPRRSPADLRVRVGHVLISLGAAISGERLERRPRPAATGHHPA